METPLTPLEFVRRTRALYPDREAVVDGDLRLTYAQFFERCDRWSVGPPEARRRQGRPRRLHRAEHPRPPGGVLRRAPDRRGPRPDQLPPDRRRLRLHHRPQRREGRLRPRRLPGGGRRHPRPDPERRALRRARRRAGRLARLRGGSLDASSGQFERPEIAETDLLSINYTSGTTSRPKGVMITHRNAYMNVVGTLIHVHMTPGRPLPLDPADVPRQRLDLRLDRHGRRRHPRLPAPRRPGPDLPGHRRPSGSRCSAPRRPC